MNKVSIALSNELKKLGKKMPILSMYWDDKLIYSWFKSNYPEIYYNIMGVAETRKTAPKIRGKLIPKLNKEKNNEN